MMIALIISGIIMIYLAVAFATFEKFTQNNLVPKAKIIALLFTPIIIVGHYLQLAYKSKSKSATKRFLKLATLHYPIGVGLYIEAVTVNLEYNLETIQNKKKHGTTTEKIVNNTIIKAPTSRAWNDTLITH